MAKKKRITRPRWKPGSVAITQTEDGLHIGDSVLWLDSLRSGKLSFLSTADIETRPAVPQIMATEETVKVLEATRRKANALVCQYNRPFSLGRFKMELLPSGVSLGSASLMIETPKTTILYAPFLQRQKVGEAVRQMQLRKAQTLVIGAWHPQPTAALPSRKREVSRLLRALRAEIERGERPVLLCPPLTVALELLPKISKLKTPTHLHDTIYRVSKTYESYGAKLGTLSRFSRRHARERIAIFPLTQITRSRSRIGLPDGPLFVITDTEAMPVSLARKDAQHFQIGSSSDGPELRQIIEEVSPRELFFCGPYAKRYAESCRDLCPRVTPLFANDQPTLF